MNSAELIPLRVEKLLWRGRGLARLESGQVVMLEPGVLPGEEILARVTKSKKDYVEGRAEHITTASPLRGCHPCPHSERCGGSMFGMVDPLQATGLKADILRDAVSRTLGAQNPALVGLGIHPSPAGWRYRWRGQIHVQKGRAHAMGHASNELIPIDDCHLLAAPLAAAMPGLAQRLPDGRFTIAASPVTGKALSERDQGELDFDFPKYGLRFSLPPSSFFQANWALNQTLVDLAIAAVQESEMIADLFAGSGNFALPLAKLGKSVLAVEGFGAAVTTGQRNAENLKLDGVRFREADLGKSASWNMVRKFSPQAAIIDPPRTGAKGVAELLLAIPSLTRLAWVSCDVVNTLRDVKPMLAQGWRVASMELLDMFPGTWHMEVLIVLERD